MLWDLLQEHWNALGNWEKVGTGTSEISPAGQLHQQNAGRKKILASGLPDKFTVETRLKVDHFGGGGHRYRFQNGARKIMFEIFVDNITLYRDGGTSVCLSDTSEDSFHVWRFLFDQTESTLKIYRNGIYIHTFTKFYVDSTEDGRVQTADYYSALEIHEDYFKIASGLHIPYEVGYAIITDKKLAATFSEKSIKGTVQEKKLSALLQTKKLNGLFTVKKITGKIEVLK